MLRNEVVSAIIAIGKNIKNMWFQQEDASPHYGWDVRNYLEHNFSWPTDRKERNSQSSSQLERRISRLLSMGLFERLSLQYETSESKKTKILNLW